VHKQELLQVYGPIRQALGGYKGTVIHRASINASRLTDLGWKESDVIYAEDVVTRRINKEALRKFITWEFFSVWYADDGCIAYNNGNMQTPIINLSLARYSTEDALKVKELLEEELDIKSSLYQTGHNVLRIGTEAAIKVFNNIKDKALKGVEYKYYFFEAYLASKPLETVFTTVIVEDEPSRSTRRIRIDLHVQDNHNFYTSVGLAHNCLVTKQNGKLIAYSRNGKPITSIDHILKDLQWIPEDYTLDGELYLHGVPLQTIGSLVRKNQPDSKKLVYVVYDVIGNANYDNRNSWLAARIGVYKKGTVAIQLAPTFVFAESKMPIKDRLAESIASGYEGLILRHDNTGYEVGKRSQSLVKVKQVLDGEFCIVGVHQSADGWAIFECCKLPGVYYPKDWAVNPESSFKVSAMGTMQEKHDAWTNRNDFIGKMLTVEFFEITIDGKPFHPVAIGIRGVE
jgi:hypothetical protein